MTADAICLTKSVFGGIIAHARGGKPEEVCGILRGRGNNAFELVHGRNVAPDPVKDYVIDPQTLLRQFDFEEEGDEMVAIYHSHPVSPAYPSGSDAWNAHYPDLAYIICSLEDDETPVVRAFRMQGHEVALNLTRLRAELKFDETRPGRFAYYQPADIPLHPALDAIGAQVSTPFYVVFEVPEEAGKKITLRVVSVIEYEIEIVAD